MQLSDAAYCFDPADPRSPSQEQWDRMSAVERARVLAMLPAEVPWEDLDGVARKEKAERHAFAEAMRADILELKLAEALAKIERLEKQR